MDIYRITPDPLVPAEALTAVSDPAAGAEALFVGTVRDHFEGRASRGLFYEAYEGLAEKELARIGEELKREFGVIHVVIMHRIGELNLEEASVVVAVSAGHREAAFLAARAGIDRVKTRAPIWKRERWADGEEQWHHDNLPG